MTTSDGPSITLELGGEPTLDDLVGAMSALRDLLDALGQEVAPGVKIDWTVSGLRVGEAS